jgi:hypothetical protein
VNSAGHAESPDPKVWNWLLAILRFAVTRAPSDRESVIALAQRMDRAGSGGHPTGFTYFVRTSAEFCDAIAAGADAGEPHRLNRHLGMIDDRRLREALAAAVDPERMVAKRAEAKARDRAALWKGLASRPTHATPGR